VLGHPFGDGAADAAVEPVMTAAFPVISNKVMFLSQNWF